MTRGNKKCLFCSKYADFISPWDLCKFHWERWWNYELTPEETAKLNEVLIEAGLTPIKD